jgi:aminopeptidase N
MICPPRFLIIFYLIFNEFCSSSKAGSIKKQSEDPLIENGVSKQLAIHRKAVISNIHYQLSFDLPGNRDQPISSSELLSFHIKKDTQALQVDFREDAKKIKLLLVNGKAVAINLYKEHLIIPPKYLRNGANVISIKFIAGEGALNRNPDYLYSLFVPDRARTVFPCFDQPDLKGRYKLTLTLPTNWKAIANSPLKDSVLKGNRKTYRFLESDVLSTYLFSFAAGKFDLIQQQVQGKNTSFLYRETDSAKIVKSVPEVFKIHRESLKFFENWTSIPYPFQKFGFIAIPDFQFGGMEHPGNIQYKSSSLFLDEGATKDQRNARSNLIAHETAHMWFGDLVTMNWFTDVWMKEVFANFMADKSMEDSIGRNEYDLKFLIDHFPSAYSVDRTQGSNPIRQDLDNLKDAGSLYGNIIYHKAPVVMRQLERLMGKENFQLGVRKYLKTYAHGNASWPDFINILNKYSSLDLLAWNKVWVNEKGRPVINYQMDLKDGKVQKFIVSQKAENGANKIWPQLFEVTFYYPNFRQEFTVDMNALSVEIKTAAGMKKPLFVLFNSSGQGYGQWPVDTAMLTKIYTIDNPVSRASAYISLYENMLGRRSVKPKELFKLLLNGLAIETEELNLKLMTNYLSIIYWNFTSLADREIVQENLEGSLWNTMELQQTLNNKKIIFKAYQEVFGTSHAVKRLYEIWRNQKAPEGIKLTEDDFTSLSFSLALRHNVDSSILSQQLTRITNKDRRIRFQFITPALSADSSVRDAFFKRLQIRSNRSKESNVLAALVYLHHPLRQQTSIKYLGKSLELLSEIQSTGDIFFPQSWLQATLGTYQNPVAGNIVKDFLKTHPDYNPKLRAKILQASDNLFRAESLLK